MTEETIFWAALQKSDPAERSAYLDAACAGNLALRQQVETLLRYHADPNSFLDVPAVVRQARVDETAPTVGSLSAAANGPRDPDLAILGPPRGPEALGSLDHYEVLERIGRGGMGVVYKARDTKLQRIVAIKILATHLAAEGTSRQRFVREAQAAAAIRDTHVVGIHAVQDDAQVPYLVMEFISGRTLEVQIKSHGPPTVKEILRIAMQSAEGLAAAHKQGLIHRDVKPANILLENGVQRVKLVDFGLARVNDNANLTFSGMIAGTAAYMSPEQTRGDHLDHRSDLFSLGSVLYFVCTGSPAFVAANTMAILESVRANTPRPIRQLNAEIPEWLAAIVDKLLAKDPKDRFQTAAEVAELLGDHLARLQQAGPVAEIPTFAAKPVLPVPGKRTRIVLAATGILTTSVLALVIYAAFNWPFSPRDPQENNTDALAPADPKVLTVSQQPADGGRFRTIGAALDKVEPGMTIRVLDDAIYEEQIKIDQPEQYRGLVLEAAAGKKPTLQVPKDQRVVPPDSYCVGIWGVARVTVRGFRISAANVVTSVLVTNYSPGIVLEKLDLLGSPNADGITLDNLPLTPQDSPIWIQNCNLRNLSRIGIFIVARNASATVDQSASCANVIIRNNDFVNVPWAMMLLGAPQRILIVGNRIVDCLSGFELHDFLPKTENVVIANNTMYRNWKQLSVWDKDNEGLSCKNIRFQNNLVLHPRKPADLFFLNHPERGVFKNDETPGDIKGLLKKWRFSHNWREISPPSSAEPDAKFWIPRGSQDKLQEPIPVLSRTPGAKNFLQPATDSPLGKAGAGLSDKALTLPSYVGAVPPAGVEDWDWSKTWKALAR